ncbi:uncharacterized protein LOC114289349 [Camellia sinensis]|uniref:Uncharacterized protein n=1 Tax=Camellia sinensis var. sinensis TaxID=542762 RepID=A0A4S4DQK6_CAMSN|nr:uncharacterized protein LOC114289349 [Camellia sinensis]THG05383.1 hypothetical protein TEA_015468 [Camellia sinensis var. sinensis]
MTGGFELRKRKSSNSIPGNPFKIVNVSPSSPVNTDSTELRISDDPKKLLDLLAAFVGLFTNHSKEDASSGSAGQDQDPPNKILANVALSLGLSAAAAANGDATPPVNGSIERSGALRKDKEEEEEEEDGYRQRSKKQRIILDSDAESIPDSSQCTPPPTKSEGSTAYSPDSAASVANRSRITRSSDGKFRRQLPMGNPNSCENNLAIVPQSIEHPAVKEAFDSVRETLQPILLQKVTRIRKDELTVEFGLETAASINLLNLVNASIHGLEEISERARLGVTLLEEGQKKVNKGKHILFSAISEIPKRIK